METTLGTAVPPYIGVDLTDRHAKNVRPIDVCGIRVEDCALVAEFWQWRWTLSERSIDVAKILPEFERSRSVMIDGPQGFAMPGRKMRSCERLTSAAGKTPEDWPEPGRPFSGFIRSSLEFFQAIRNAEVPVGASSGIGACEVYPGDIWKRLARRRLAKKRSPQGRELRRNMLVELGLKGLPQDLSHDLLDAAVSAVVAACVDSAVPGLELEAIGEELILEDHGVLREGFMSSPVVSESLRARLDLILDRNMSPETAVPSSNRH